MACIVSNLFEKALICDEIWVKKFNIIKGHQYWIKFQINVESIHEYQLLLQKTVPVHESNLVPLVCEHKW